MKTRRSVRDRASRALPDHSVADSSERGAVLYLMFLFLGIFLAVAALAVDLAAVGARGQTLQNTADAAALAGAFEYEEQLLTGSDQVAARAAAQAVVEEIMAVNGVDPAAGDITVTVAFPERGTVTVEIYDDDVQTILSDVQLPGVQEGVTRSATAEYLACDNNCNITVQIPKPFTSVSAAGRGDGYKPIAVGSKFYAINHNSTSRQIVCVDRDTQKPCWTDALGNPVVARDAYAPSVGFNFDPHPEMPHTAVVGTRIYWSVSTLSHGHRLYCFETATDTPCSTAFSLAPGLLREDKSLTPLTSDKDENRGGGTVNVNDKVFVFTDDHRIHCYDPATNALCANFFAGGLDTGLAAFPDNDPYDGNTGSSIDRIVDESTGFIYSVIRVVHPQTVTADCLAPTVTSDLDDLVDQVVVIRNPASGRYLAAAGIDNVVTSNDISDTGSQWRILRESNGTFYLHNQRSNINEVLDGANSPAVLPTGLGTDGNTPEPDNQWNLQLDPVSGNFAIEYTLFDSFVNDSGGSVVQENSGLSGATLWEFAVCDHPSSDLQYSSGTWLHCFDSGQISGFPAPCTNFAPRKIHENASRFSGRLFFFYDPVVGTSTPVERGVCSSGFDDPSFDTNPTPLDVATLEINCYPLFDAPDPTVPDTFMTGQLAPLADEIRLSTGSSPGAWGDPHWNDYENRLFYPTERLNSRVICWDFDSGFCESIQGETPPSPSGVVSTMDYGFVSDGDCVFGLGHNAHFWAFRASDIDEPCVGAISRAPIERCPCSDGTIFKWGILDFRNIDLTDFDVFNVRIITDPDNDIDPTNDGDEPEQLYPVPSIADPNIVTYHSIKPGGASPLIDLGEDGVGIDPSISNLQVEIYVEAENDPFDTSTPYFVIDVVQQPRLTE